MVEAIINKPIPHKPVDDVINTPLPERPSNKRRRTVVWSVNVFTVVLFLVDPKYALCEGKYKQVSKRFRKALEIVLRCTVTEATNYIEFSAPLVADLQRQYLQSDGFTAIRRICGPLGIKKVASVGAITPQASLQDRKNLAIMLFTVATTSMSDETYEYDETLPTFDKNTIENILYCQSGDKDDMAKLNKLLKKLVSEVAVRGRAC